MAALLDRLRRHERSIALAWLTIPVILGLALVLGPVRAAILDQAQVAVLWWSGSWMEQLQEAQRLLDEGRFVEATEFLERIDRKHPARNVRHALGTEREWLLRLLAQSYEGLDRRTFTIATYQRLVAFDPNHYRNYFELAEASNRLLSRTTMAAEARDAYAAALEIFPVHLPSLRGYITYYLDQGQFLPVVQSYERYLNAFFVHEVEVRVGDAVVRLPVLVDGRQRDFEIPMATTLSGGDVVTIDTRGFAVAVERAEVRSAIRAGVVARIDSVSADIANPELVEFERAENSAFRPTGANSSIRLPLRAGLDSVVSLRLRLAIFKPVDRDLWAAVTKSYKNLLNEAGHIAAAERTVAFNSSENADLVVGRLDWAKEGTLP